MGDYLPFEPPAVLKALVQEPLLGQFIGLDYEVVLDWAGRSFHRVPDFTSCDGPWWPCGCPVGSPYCPDRPPPGEK